MAKELFIHIDYTDKESTKIRVSNYINHICFEHTVDLTQISLETGLKEALSLYKVHYIQLSKESQYLIAQSKVS